MNNEFSQNIVRAGMDIGLFLDGILNKLGLMELTGDDRQAMKQMLKTTLEKFFMSQVLEMASEEQAEEMNKILDKEGGLEQLMKYIQDNFDQDGRLMKKVLHDFHSQIIGQMKDKE